MPSSDVDYYKVLGVTHSATSAEIKAAYHQAAKRSHPDAGGSAEAMQLVNEAYAVLSDAGDRSDYDGLSSSDLRPRPPATRHAGAPPRPAAPHPTAGYREPPRHAAQHHPTLDAIARRSAWRIIGYNALAAVFLGFITSFMYNFTTDTTSRIIVALSAFVPVYFVMCGIIFIYRPRLRIALARLGAAHLPPTRDLAGLLALGLMSLPLAGIWLIGYAHGVLR